jgi:hypothetical protein
VADPAVGGSSTHRRVWTRKPFTGVGPDTTSTLAPAFAPPSAIVDPVAVEGVGFGCGRGRRAFDPDGVDIKFCEEME